MSEIWSAAGLSLGLSATAVMLASLPGVPLAAALGLSRSARRDVFLVTARVGMSFPTVVVGLLVYGLFSRTGPLGGLGLLYTPQVIVAGEVLLAFPLVVALGASAVGVLDPRFRDTARILGLGRARTTLLASASAPRTSPAATPRGSPRESSSAWRSPARWWPSRACSCSTNPSARSTRRAPHSWWPRCATCPI